MPVCSLCGSLDTTPTPCAFPGIVKCVKCKFIFAAVTTDSSDPELYDESWARAGLHPTYVYWKGEYVLRNRWRHEALLRRLEPFRKCNRLLDVGCSAAFFLKLAQEYGWGVQGVELSDFGVKYSREVLGVDVFQGLLEDAAFPDGSFDAAFSSHVIEHIADPRTFLREMRRIVRPAGALITTLPTQFAGLGYRIFGELTGDGPPRHVSYFTKDTFEALLREEGFDIVYSRQNIELQKLIAAARRDRLQPPRAETPRSEPTPARSDPSKPPNSLIRIVKTGLNIIGSQFGVGEELTTIGVKI